jgi:hypothetical protein
MPAADTRTRQVSPQVPLSCRSGARRIAFCDRRRHQRKQADERDGTRQSSQHSCNPLVPFRIRSS